MCEFNYDDYYGRPRFARLADQVSSFGVRHPRLIRLAFPTARFLERLAVPLF